MKLYHLICYLIFQLIEKKKYSCHKRISAGRIQCKDIKFINMKEVIQKIGMQGSVSQILNNVGELILKEFLNLYIKTQSSKNSLLGKTSFSDMFVYEHEYVCVWVSMCTCVYLWVYTWARTGTCICRLVCICIYVLVHVFESMFEYVRVLCICMNMFVHLLDPS